MCELKRRYSFYLKALTIESFFSICFSVYDAEWKLQWHKDTYVERKEKSFVFSAKNYCWRKPFSTELFKHVMKIFLFVFFFFFKTFCQFPSWCAFNGVLACKMHFPWEQVSVFPLPWSILQTFLTNLLILYYRFFEKNSPPELFHLLCSNIFFREIRHLSFTLYHRKFNPFSAKLFTLKFIAMANCQVEN